MFDLLRPYITIVRLWSLIVLMLTAIGYIGYLHHQIDRSEKEVDFLKHTVRVCDQDRSALRAATRAQVENLKALDKYYTERKCLDLRQGALTEEELQLR